MSQNHTLYSYLTKYFSFLALAICLGSMTPTSAQAGMFDTLTGAGKALVDKAKEQGVSLDKAVELAEKAAKQVDSNVDINQVYETAKAAGKQLYLEARKEVRGVVKRNGTKLPAIIAEQDDKISKYHADDQGKMKNFCQYACNQYSCQFKKYAAQLCFALCSKDLVKNCVAKADAAFPNAMKKVRDASTAVATVKTAIGL